MNDEKLSTLSKDEWRRLLRLNQGEYPPLFHQLKEALRKAAAQLEPGTLMPSEKELMEYAGVGRATARKAVGELVQEGVLYSLRGKGTYVANKRIVAPLDRPAGFSETMRRLNHVPGTRLISIERIEAPEFVRNQLHLPKGDEVYVVERLRLMDGEPCMLERTHLRAGRVPDLETHDLSSSLYELLAREYGLSPARGVETVVAVNADRRLAELLQVPLQAALLATIRITETVQGEPLEYTVRHARGDLCSFQVLLNGGLLADRHSSDIPLGEGLSV